MGELKGGEMSPGPERRATPAPMIDPGAPRELKMVVFRLTERDFALRLEDVAEILPMVALTEVPESSPWLPGVINLRGRTLPVIDLRRRLGFPARDLDPKAAIVVTEPGDAQPMGLLVDRVVDVVTVAESAFDPVDGMGGSEHPVRGLVREHDRMIVVLDLDRLTGGSPQLSLPDDLV